MRYVCEFSLSAVWQRGFFCQEKSAPIYNAGTNGIWAGFIFTGPDLTHDGRYPKGWKLKRDPYLMETSVPGIFAAGDVRHGVVRRVASAVGQGAVTISFVHKYLETV